MLKSYFDIIFLFLNHLISTFYAFIPNPMIPTAKIAQYSNTDHLPVRIGWSLWDEIYWKNADFTMICHEILASKINSYGIFETCILTLPILINCLLSQPCQLSSRQEVVCQTHLSTKVRLTVQFTRLTRAVVLDRQ